MTRVRGLAVGFALTALAAALLYLTLLLSSRTDDVFITLRYARNLALGDGLVFNPGERVEGYTCFLWIVILAGLHRLGADLITVCGGLSTALGLAALPLTYGAARLLGATPPAAILAPAFLALSPVWAFWAGSGMEAVPLGFLLALTAYLYLRRPQSASVPVLLALAVMLRPDAMLAAGAIGLERLATWRAGRPFWRRVAAFLALFAPYYVWRTAYYGYLLPNTFYAKVGSGWSQIERGTAYVGAFCTGPGLPLLALAACALWAARTRGAATLAGIVLAFLAYAAAVGGDYFGLHRFLVPVLPLLAILAARGAQAILLEWRMPALLRAGLLALALGAYGIEAARGFAVGRQMRFTDAVLVTLLRGKSEVIERSARPGDAIATIGVGVPGYYTNRRVIDMVGLTDAVIAHREVADFGRGIAGHERYDSAYVLAQKPRYIVLPGPEDPASMASVAAARDLVAQPEFLAHYEWTGLFYERTH